MNKLFCLCVFFLSAVVQAQATSTEFNAFAAEWNIQDWPRLNGCGYQTSFEGRVVGLILEVRSAQTAYSRLDGHCHVAVRHTLQQWPAELQPGRYVVAATLAPNSFKSYTKKLRSKPNYDLQILAVLGKQPNNQRYLDAALDQICTYLPSPHETDRNCRFLHRQRSQHTSLFFAAQSGQPTMDQGNGGGNPFASALIEQLDRSTLKFKQFKSALIEGTRTNSNQFQVPEIRSAKGLEDWQMLPKPKAEKRIALVLAFSDYSVLSENYSLPGAKYDLQRIADALTRSGFDTQTILDPKASYLNSQLQAFAEQSSKADVALLYVTGHGVETAGQQYLLPGDYPFKLGIDALERHAISLENLAALLRAKHANLFFSGACRDNPLAP